MIVTKEFNIAGMQCSRCETIIEEAVNQIDGGFFIKTDCLKATIKVRFDPNKTSLAMI
jgi:copper chaperone CopZ